MNATRPNIVMLVADDHESRAMGWRGHAAVQTPHLDRLAHQGTAFTRAYHAGGCDDAVCIPTRASLLTGMDCHHALQGGRDVINPDRITLPQHFRHCGYHAYVSGKWHNDLASLTRSFDDGAAVFAGGMNDHYATPIRPFDPRGEFPENEVTTCERFATDHFCDTAAEFIRTYDRQEPFFLYTAFTAPHDPRTPPAEHADGYNSEDIPLPANFQPEHPFDLGVRDIRDEMLTSYPRTTERIREEIAAYYGMITAMDTGIGQIVNALKQSGLLENTIILYTGDHGLAVGQHGLLGKQNLYEHSSRVPLILYGPGIPKNRISSALVYSWDTFPTLCELCQVSIPADLDAHSLAPVISGTADNFRERIFCQYQQTQRMLSETRWKLILTSWRGQSHVQLFDLEQDPDELQNLASHPDCRQHVERLTNQLASSPAGLPYHFTHD
ncbi:MAG: sulfatase-like hydrolase/transferase [Verrucomicrobiota bacterium]